MKLHLQRLAIPLKEQFTIARGTLREQRILIVELEQDGVRGYGEATAHAYYNVTQDSLAESIEACRELIESQQYASATQLWDALDPTLAEDKFALSAIDAAAHDLFGKLNGRRTFEMLGLEWNPATHSSYTIGIDSIDRMIDKLNEKSGWSIFKIKLGTAEDLEIVRQLRQHTDARFRVDANCGWSVDETIENSHALKELGVEFIEQPLPASASAEDNQRVFQNSVLPIIADESCREEADVERCHGLFHGINVKLCKCGGITPGFRMLKQARQLGMQTMVGCMVESTIGISAAAQLLPLLNYADLDGAELLGTQIATGVRVEHGVVTPANEHGLGIELLSPATVGVSDRATV